MLSNSAVMGRRKTKFRIKRMVTERRVPRPHHHHQHLPNGEKEEELSAEDVTNGSTSGFSGKAKIIRSSDGRMGMLIPEKKDPTVNDGKESPTSCANRRVKTKPRRIPPDTCDVTSDNLFEQINVFLTRISELVNALMKSYHDCGGQAYVYNKHILQDRKKEELIDKRRKDDVPKQFSELKLTDNPTTHSELKLPKEVLSAYQFEDFFTETKEQVFAKQVDIVMIVKELSKAVKSWFSLDNRLGGDRITTWTNQCQIREDLCMLLEKVMLTQHISRIKSYLSNKRSDIQLYARTREISIEIEHGEIIGDVYYPAYPRKPIQFAFLKKPRPLDQISFTHSLTNEQKELAMNLRVQFVFLYRNMAYQNCGNVNFWAFVEHTIQHVLSSVGIDRFRREDNSAEYFFGKSLEVILRIQGLCEAEYMSDSRCVKAPSAREDILKLASFIYQLTETDGYFPILLPPQSFDPPVFASYQNAPYLVNNFPNMSETSLKSNLGNLSIGLKKTLKESAAGKSALVIVQEVKSTPYARATTDDETVTYMDIGEYAAYVHERQRLGLPMHWEINIKVVFDEIALPKIETQLKKVGVAPENVAQIQRVYHLQQIQQMHMHFLCSPTALLGSIEQKPNNLRVPMLPLPSYAGFMTKYLPQGQSLFKS